MQTGHFRARMLYLSSFGAALWSGFFTYRFFDSFRRAAGLGEMVVMLDTVILLLLWHLALTSHSDFVRENTYLVLVGPLIAVYATNLYFALSTSTLDVFLPFVGVSLLLFVSSERFGSYERRLKEEKTEGERQRF